MNSQARQWFCFSVGFFFLELTIQPSLNSILLPRHIADPTLSSTVPASQNENSTATGETAAPMSETANAAEQSTSNMA